MNTKEMNLNEWMVYLNKLDKELAPFALEGKIKILSTGGFALMLHSLIDRPTGDLDGFIWDKDNILLIEDLDYKDIAHDSSVNSFATAYGVEKLLKKDMDQYKLYEGTQFTNFELYIPSVEILILVKLIASIDRERDLVDLNSITDNYPNLDSKKLTKYMEYWYYEIAQRKEQDAFNEIYEKWFSDYLEKHA